MNPNRLPRPTERIIILDADDIDFGFEQRELSIIIDEWQAGTPLPDIARAIRRKNVEVALAVIHLHRTGQIECRRGGVWGG